ncbi:MAG: hypothetical protein ABFC86_00615, partial [Rectinema sp.]
DGIVACHRAAWNTLFALYPLRELIFGLAFLFDFLRSNAMYIACLGIRKIIERKPTVHNDWLCYLFERYIRPYKSALRDAIVPRIATKGLEVIP